MHKNQRQFALTGIYLNNAYLCVTRIKVNRIKLNLTVTFRISDKLKRYKDICIKDNRTTLSFGASVA